MPLKCVLTNVSIALGYEEVLVGVTFTYLPYSLYDKELRPRVYPVSSYISHEYLRRVTIFSIFGLWTLTIFYSLQRI